MHAMSSWWINDDNVTLMVTCAYRSWEKVTCKISLWNQLADVPLTIKHGPMKSSGGHQSAIVATISENLSISPLSKSAVFRCSYELAYLQMIWYAFENKILAWNIRWSKNGLSCLDVHHYMFYSHQIKYGGLWVFLVVCVSNNFRRWSHVTANY